MKINNLSEIVIPDLTIKMGSGDYFNDLPSGLYTNEQLLSEAHKMEKIAFPFPKDEIEYLGIFNSWHGCNVFGWRYSFGHINGCSLKKEKQLRRQYYSEKGYKREELRRQYKAIEIDFTNERLRPLQNEHLKNIQKKFLSYEIIASLLALDIDPIKFWYAMLWLMDFIEDRTNDVSKCEQTPFEGFSAMLKRLRKLYDEEDNENCKYDSGELTLKVGDERKLKITNVDTLRILGKIIDEYLDKYQKANGTMEYIELHSYRCTSFEKLLVLEKEKKGNSHLMKIYLFHKYMKEYLKRYKGKRNLRVVDYIENAPKEYANNKASVDKELLISRLAWVVGFVVDKECYYIDNKAIKSTLRKFRPIKVMPHYYEY